MPPTVTSKGLVFNFPSFISKRKPKSLIVVEAKSERFRLVAKAVRAGTLLNPTDLVENDPLPIRLAKSGIISFCNKELKDNLVENLPAAFSKIGANFCKVSTCLNISVNKTSVIFISKLTDGFLGSAVLYK